MSISEPRVKAIALQASKDPRRSPLFHWLRKNYKTLAPLLIGRRVNWAPVIALVETAGVTDYAGGVPTEHTLRRTWRTVRQVLEAEQAAQGANPPRKPQPRDLPATWRPTALAISSASPPVSPEGETKRRMTGEEARDSLYRSLLERSGRTE